MRTTRDNLEYLFAAAGGKGPHLAIPTPSSTREDETMRTTTGTTCEPTEMTEEELRERGWNEEEAHVWAGWYYGDGVTFYDDIFLSQFDAVAGPIRDNVNGPFATEADAIGFQGAE